MNVRQMIKAQLVACGADGLAGDECGCELNELMPCESPDLKGCVAAKKLTPAEAIAQGFTNASSFDFYMVPMVEMKEIKGGNSHV